MRYIWIVALIFLGCANKTNSVTYVEEGVSKPMSLTLEYQDIEKASVNLINSMLKSPYLNEMYKKKKSPLVIMISNFTNDTTQKIDMDMLLKRIRIALLNSGKFITTTALRAGGAEDKATFEVRKYRKNEEFNLSTLPKKHTIIAPDLSLSGKIIQKVTMSGDKQRVDYFIQMSLTDVKTGLAFWEGESVISKAGSSKAAPW